MIGFWLVFVVSCENEGLFVCFSSNFSLVLINGVMDFFLCFVLFVRVGFDRVVRLSFEG